jgi:hypothetical protein
MEVRYGAVELGDGGGEGPDAGGHLLHVGLHSRGQSQMQRSCLQNMMILIKTSVSCNNNMSLRIARFGEDAFSPAFSDAI